MWPSETPWPAVILSVTCAIGFFIVWTRQRKNWQLVAILLSLLVSVIGWEYDRLIVTEREKVVDSVRGIVLAFQRRDYDEMMSYISNSSRDLQLLAASAYNMVKLGPDTRIFDIEVQMLPRNERAITVFRVNTTLTAAGVSERYASMWEARWQPEAGGWKMIDIMKCDPVTEKRELIPDEWRVRLNQMYPQPR